MSPSGGSRAGAGAKRRLEGDQRKRLIPGDVVFLITVDAAAKRLGVSRAEFLRQAIAEQTGALLGGESLAGGELAEGEDRQLFTVTAPAASWADAAYVLRSLVPRVSLSSFVRAAGYRKAARMVGGEVAS